MHLTIKTHAQTEMIDITAQVQKIITQSGVPEGLCMVYVPHTTAAVTINEAADPSVATDILMVLNQLVPWNADYRHAEGNSPAHIKASLMGASQMIQVEKGQLVLGTWQGIFFCEFDGPRSRKVNITLR
ncbi:MAG: secondary thiamine-phosphate synthase enzyme YjbQ [Desulfobacteraceae bacterium]|nr:secondary thiamine-phosphate synthase enzyme YjbQ [Desulfobacteraceae bacterium]